MDKLLDSLTGNDIVIDTDSRFSYIGTCKTYDDRFVEISNVAIYDDAIVKVTLEEFLIECKQHGAPVSRGKTLVSRERILAISSVEELIVI